MRIWLWSVLIIKTGGEQALYIATDHVWRQAQSIPSADEIWPFFMTASCRERQSFFAVCAVWELQSQWAPLSDVHSSGNIWSELQRYAFFQFEVLLLFHAFYFPTLFFFAPLNLKVVSHVSKWTVFTTHYGVSIQCKLSLPLHSLSHSDASDQVLASSVGCTVFQSNMLL